MTILLFWDIIPSNTVEDGKYNYQMTLVSANQRRNQSSLFEVTSSIQLGIWIEEGIPI